MKYRMEIDALNALIDEQKRTNELLEKLIELNTQQSKETPVKASDTTPKQRRKRQ